MSEHDQSSGPEAARNPEQQAREMLGNYARSIIDSVDVLSLSTPMPEEQYRRVTEYAEATQGNPYRRDTAKVHSSLTQGSWLNTYAMGAIEYDDGSQLNLHIQRSDDTNDAQGIYNSEADDAHFRISFLHWRVNVDGSRESEAFSLEMTKELDTDSNPSAITVWDVPASGKFTLIKGQEAIDSRQMKMIKEVEKAIRDDKEKMFELTSELMQGD